MNILRKPKIVLLGMMSQIPVAGHVWVVMHYLVGFQRLGYDVYYVEAHGRTPTQLMRHADEDCWSKAADFIAGIMARLDLGHRWAYHAFTGNGRCYGLSERELKQLYGSAALLINLHGGTMPLPEQSATGRLVYLETDPVLREVQLYQGSQKVRALMEPHCAFFTWGLNYGSADCTVPLPEQFHFRPTRPPVVMDLWDSAPTGGERFTTVGNWRQPGDLHYNGDVYHWSKHHEFMKFIDLPSRTEQVLELALGSCDEQDQRLLESNGWHVRAAAGVSEDTEVYRRYVQQSRGEFTVAKDQNVRLRSGWFSERSAQYLAAGRPVITQETGFSNQLPTGAGLFGFSTLNDILAAIEIVNSSYEEQCRAARELAQAYFNYDVVLQRLLDDVGV